jgi:hypothetical protein
VDVGYGDSVTPPALPVDFPTLLAFPAPTVRAYGKETVVAEKLHAMVPLGMANSRMKDFFDIWFLCRGSRVLEKTGPADCGRRAERSAVLARGGWGLDP